MGRNGFDVRVGSALLSAIADNHCRVCNLCPGLCLSTTGTSDAIDAVTTKLASQRLQVSNNIFMLLADEWAG